MLYTVVTGFFLGTALRLYLLNQISPLCRTGISSPNNLPHGLRLGTLSKIIFNTPINGIAKNIPGIPHKAFPINTITIDTNALIRTLEETIIGIKK
ncbi:MAG: hypothetical protein WDM90_07575 [Ferruginibacter sp.]